MSDNVPDIMVSVDFHCSRKNKVFPVRTPIREAQAHADMQVQKQAAANEIGQLISDLEVPPDCVVLYKGRCVVLANVHESNDSAVGRLLNEVVQQDSFPTKEPKKRTRKAAPVESVVEVETEIEIIEESE